MFVKKIILIHTPPPSRPLGQATHEGPLGDGSRAGVHGQSRRPGGGPRAVGMRERGFGLWLETTCGDF